MIKVSVFYANNEGSKFDMDYYCDTHIPLIKQKLGDALLGFSLARGVGGAVPGAAATFIVIGEMLFESLAVFQTAFGPHARIFAADTPNYTDIRPTVQISEVLM